MTQKEPANESSRETEKTLKAGINIYTSTANLLEPVKDEDIFRALSSKPGYEEF
ncbi:MAG: hypothetical protein V3574_02155 [Candidatus Moraniibacteriota bacterium]